ncbi:MAG: sialidase family protein, partial [Mycobacteriales bacterium]
SGDADHTILADGTILADNLCLAGPSNLLYRSTDHGKTWHPAGPAGQTPGEAGVDSDRQWLTPDPKDASVVWMSYHDLAGPNVWVAKSIDGGATFPQRIPATAFGTEYANSSQGNTTARIIVKAKGEQRTLYLFYAYSDAPDAIQGTLSPTDPDFLLRKIGLAKSTDGGLTWTNTVVYDGTSIKARLGHPFTTAAIDPAGNLYVAISMRKEPSKSTSVYMLRSTNDGASWTQPILASGTVNKSNVMPSIVAPRPGVVDLAYYATKVDDFDSRAGEWAPVFAQTKNALAAKPTFTRSRIGGANHNRDICLAGTLCAVTGGNRNLADYLGLTVDPKGFAQVVWTEDVECAGCTVYAEQTRQP